MLFFFYVEVVQQHMVNIFTSTVGKKRENLSIVELTFYHGNEVTYDYSSITFILEKVHPCIASVIIYEGDVV